MLPRNLKLWRLRACTAQGANIECETTEAENRTRCVRIGNGTTCRTSRYAKRTFNLVFVRRNLYLLLPLYFNFANFHLLRFFYLPL